MKEAFEKILERLDEMIHPKQLHFCKCARGRCRLFYNNKNCMDCVVKLAKEIVQEVAEEYNNSWIPCSVRLPEECIEVLVSVKEIDGSIYTRTSWIQDDVWVIKKTPLNPTVIAWQPLPEPYKEKEQ